ncbi:hypothetical protein [Scytonema sp. PCC 10023]|uniref:hypothetical protein n=1 Tax=Scytonema sp. PCC 10023 TaxID=1680591 RepID=UPI0039C6FB67
MPITLDKPTITSLKTYRIISEFEYTYFGLQLLKDPTNSSQDIDTDAFEADWGVSNTNLMRYLQTLETRKVLKITPGPVQVTWDQNETTTISQAEVLSMRKDGIINSTAYVYYALLLNKGGGLVQGVEPTDYSVAPWSITPSTLLQELTAISQKTNEGGSKVLTLDLSNVSVIWLV